MWISVPELENLLGKDAAHVLIKQRGGVDFYVPSKPESTHPLARLLGLPAFHTLCRAFGGERITAPNGRSEPQKERIVRLLQSSMPKADIAAECGVTERYVYMVASYESGRQQQLTLPL